MRLTSPAFDHGEFIPKKYTCQGENINPELVIEDVPMGAKSLVLIIDDPDAPMGTWDHWVVWNIPPNVTIIGEDSVPPDAVVGKNSWGKNEYGGPCPPSGIHRYFFKLYALDIELDLEPSATKSEVEQAMRGHVLAEAVLMGKYSKK